MSRTDPLASLGESLRLFTAEGWDGANVTLECPEMTKVSQSEVKMKTIIRSHMTPRWSRLFIFYSSIVKPYQDSKQRKSRKTLYIFISDIILGSCLLVAANRNAAGIFTSCGHGISLRFALKKALKWIG